MSESVYTQFLEEIGKLVSVNEQHKLVFKEHLQVVHLEKNELWEKEGSIATHAGFVNKGIMRQFYQKDGDEFTDKFYKERDFLGNFEIVTEVHAAHIFVLDDFFRRARHEHLAIMQNIGAIHNFQCFSNVMISD